MTRPLNAAGKQLTANVVTVKEGTLTAELVRNGKPLRGFAKADCKPVRGDHHAAPLRWSGGGHCPADDLQIRFYLQRARLYGFDV
jgi:hypothetical protein